MTLYNARPNGYDDIKDLAKSESTTIADLLALARQNDPFFAGAPAQREKAEWFLRLWNRFGYSTGVHLRRVHYQLVSQRNPTRHDGLPYENTEGCWNYLCEAGKAARYLGLIPATAFEDRRNPAPHLYVEYEAGRDLTPRTVIDRPWWRLPQIDTELGWQLEIRLPDVNVAGYGYTAADQPYHIELWVEKSTMDDVLIPVCQRFGVNYVTSLGFQSITSVIALLRRCEASGKPCRIFYISDFDPAGDAMPVAVARQVEYWAATYAPEVDLKLTPLALTRQHVTTWELPRIPIKDSDLRQKNFALRYGEGAVELDALEALHPGELARIVMDAVRAYRDPSLSRRLGEAARDARQYAARQWSAATIEESDALFAIEAEAREILEVYQADVNNLSARMAAEMAPLNERLDEIRQAVLDKSEAFSVDLPDRPDADNSGDSIVDAAWLLDTAREYLQQIGIYKVRRNRREDDESRRNRPEDDE